MQAFRNKYLPAMYQTAKVREFTNLRQGKMSVSEYEVKFDQFSRYATHIILSEWTKCIKFKEGLRFGVKNRITADDM